MHCMWSLSSEVHVHRRVNLQCVYVLYMIWFVLCTVYWLGVVCDVHGSVSSTTH